MLASVNVLIWFSLLSTFALTATSFSLSPQAVHTYKPHFLALHCQEVGGKNYEASMSHVDSFVKYVRSS